MKERDPDEVKEIAASENHEDIKSEDYLLTLLESRLHFILKNIIQYCRSRPNKDYEKMADMYKKMYSVSLRIKKSDDVAQFAESLCDVLESIDAIAKEYE